jgi:hypothetical protein
MYSKLNKWDREEAINIMLLIESRVHINLLPLRLLINSRDQFRCHEESDFSISSFSLEDISLTP